MFTKTHSKENKKMLERAQYILCAFSVNNVVIDLQQLYPNVSVARIHRIADKAQRIIQAQQIRERKNRQ